MPDSVSIKAVFDLPPERAIAFLDSKGYRTSVDWTDTFNEEHDASFTVAKIAKVDLLRAIHISLLEAQTNGQPFDAWLKDLKPALADAGWWGKVADASITGTDKPVFVGPRRLRTIYDVNLRMARSAALWERVQASKADLPFLRYSAVLDRRTRPLHRDWHNTILPVDHPWWQTHFPPCGWNCRCTVVQYSQAMLDRRNLTVTEAPPPSTPVPFYNKSTGQTVQVPRGIDPGFGYNPGVARMQAVAQKVAASLVQARGEGLILDDAALAEILADLPPGSVTLGALAMLQALVAAADVAQLAAAVLGMMGVSLATAATKRKGQGRARLKGGSYSHGGRADQKRDGGGRFADEGREKPGDAPAILLGPMPVARINAVLGTKLAPGTIRLSATIHAKVKSGKHAEDYQVFTRHAAAIRTAPDFIGRDPNHPDKIALIKAVPGLSRGRTHMILPVYGKLDRHGNYGAASAFGLNSRQLADRIAKGWYLPVRP